MCLSIVFKSVRNVKRGSSEKKRLWEGSANWRTLQDFLGVSRELAYSFDPTLFVVVGDPMQDQQNMQSLLNSCACAKDRHL